MTRCRSIGATAAALTLGLVAASAAQAASHREAPAMTLDPGADITDVYAFVSYDNPDRVTLILDVDPLLEPSNGPTYFPFDPDITYAIKVDNNFDAVEDITFEFRFQNEVRLPGVFTVYVGAGDGIAAPANEQLTAIGFARITRPAQLYSEFIQR